MQDNDITIRRRLRLAFSILAFILFIAMIVAILLMTGVIRWQKDAELADSTTAVTEAETTGAEESEKGGELRVKQEIIDGMAPATEVDGITITEEMLEKGILNEGNKTRLMDVMERAAKGETITIAYIGGSITAGSLANPMATACYAALSTDWWKATFPDATINYVNAGIGATDSWVGVHRAADDVIAKNPDLVIVEFSVNDVQGRNQETYDSLLRALLSSGTSKPAVISLLIAQKFGGFADKHAPAAFRYSVPIISYSALLTQKLVPWEKVGNPDAVHPDNPGHQLIAHLLTTYYRRVLAEINTAEPGDYQVPPLTDSATKCRYLNGDILYSDELTPDSAEGFAAGKVYGILFNDNGWKTESAGTISFTVEAREVGVIWLQKNTDPEGKCASYDLFIDGEQKAVLQGAADSWGIHLEYYSEILGDTEAKHTIELRPTPDNTGSTFEILGIGISR